MDSVFALISLLKLTPLIVQSGEGGTAWGQISFTLIDRIGGIRIRGILVNGDWLQLRTGLQCLDSAQNVHLYTLPIDIKPKL